MIVLHVLQVHDKSFDLKEGMHVAMEKIFEPTDIHVCPIYCHVNYLVCRRAAVGHTLIVRVRRLIVRVQRLSPWQHASIHPSQSKKNGSHVRLRMHVGSLHLPSISYCNVHNYTV